MKKAAQKPLVSIVVLNWNGLENTKQCIESVKKLNYPNYELIVVDNGSQAHEKEYLQTLSDIIYIDNHVNRGFTGGHIDGLAQASGDFVVLLNNDALIDPNYLDRAITHFEDESVAVVGGRAYFWNENCPPFDTTSPYYSYQEVNVTTGEAITHQTDFGSAQEVNNVSGSCVMVRKKTIDEIGYLYERFFAYFEETDLFARVKRAGYKVIYSPDLHIWHKNGASSGSTESPFVYHQLFRNRFIFAVRNFETAYLWRFLIIYARMSVGALLRTLLRRPTNQVMNRAYTKAAFYSLFTLPLTLASRHKLQKQLGKSNYNHIIYGEQTGVSFVIDCRGKSATEITKLKNKYGTDTNPLHEYIIITKDSQPAGFDKTLPNVRLVTDRGYFTANPLNIGILAARFDWVATYEPGYEYNPLDVHAAVAETLRSPERLVVFGDSKQLAPLLLLHKEFFQRVGGLPKDTDFSEAIQQLVAYARKAKLLRWHRTSQATTLHLRVFTTEEREKINRAIHYDEALIGSKRVSTFDKIKAKYYRIYQTSTFVHWLFLRNVSLYLKAARLKNLVVFTLTLNTKKLATEFKHIRNEVILNRRSGVNVAAQNKRTKEQLAAISQTPQDIPIFIICRDRLEPLEKLIDWLEKHGLRKIVLIDNDSLFPPLVEYFDKTPYQVLKLYRNVGHTSPWTLSIVRALIPDEFYVVTDPDVIPIEECPSDVMSYFLGVHKRFAAYQKVGFGLRIDDLPNKYPLKQQVIDWETQFWQQKLDDEIYEAGVDTTFALYKPFTYFYMLHPSIRTGYPYVARHLPWYTSPKEVTKEEEFYRARLDQSINSWNTEALADRYTKEMKRTEKARAKIKAKAKKKD